ncbi:MAG: efflux RND transporter periplasmic adaptor subunit [Planctomycetota bacterium]|jgi:RND family efflux transporter MFP subunit
MALSSGKSRVIGLIGGAIIMVAAVYSVFFIDWAPPLELPPPVVRPLKVFTVGQVSAVQGRSFPGTVRPNEEVDLAFQVSGQLDQFNVTNGLVVTKDQVLARVDQSDYQSALNSRQGILTKAKGDYDKFKELRERNAASEKELVDAKADYDIAQADFDTAQKALNDTTLRAPFPGVIAKTFVNNYENVNARQVVLSLQKIDNVEIEVNIPETIMVRIDPKKLATGEDIGEKVGKAVFEYLPDVEFDVSLKEYTTEADPATQTYLITLVMPASEDHTILPGMTATITFDPKETETPDADSLIVPFDAVPSDSTGNYFVWRIEPIDGVEAKATRVNVTVGKIIGNAIEILSGLQPGDRIAAAGVQRLKEGQIVRPIQPADSSGAAEDPPDSQPSAEATVGQRGEPGGRA